MQILSDKKAGDGEMTCDILIQQLQTIYWRNQGEESTKTGLQNESCAAPGEKEIEKWRHNFAMSALSSPLMQINQS